MTDPAESDAEEMRRELAAAFDESIDPLAEAEDGFRETGIDPFRLFQLKR